MSQLKKIKINNLSLSESRSVNFELSYQLFGRPLHAAPVVLVNHALTGNSQVAGPNGWWKEIIGKEKLIDLNQYTVISFDIPGNGFGQKPVQLPVDYRQIDTRLLSDLYWKALDKLGVKKLFAAIGGSLGGSIAWQMAIQRPDAIAHLIPIACGIKASDWLIGNVLVQDNILNHSENPVETARKHAMLLYRTPASLNQKFENQFKKDENQYSVESWLNYHGTTLKNRFSKDAYLLMNHLLKTIGNQLSEDDILKFASASKSKIHLIAVDSDYMFTKEEQVEVYRLVRRNKYDISYHEIESVHGHDAFLIEYEQLNQILENIFKPKIRIEKSFDSKLKNSSTEKPQSHKLGLGSVKQLFHSTA